MLAPCYIKRNGAECIKPVGDTHCMRIVASHSMLAVLRALGKAFFLSFCIKELDRLVGLGQLGKMCVWCVCGVCVVSAPVSGQHAQLSVMSEAGRECYCLAYMYPHHTGQSP